MQKQIIVICIFVIIIILVVITFSIYNSKEEQNLNYINMQDTNYDSNILNNQNSENMSNEIENNIEEGFNMNNQNENIKINLTVNNKTFSATLENNETTRELTQMFPMTIQMSDLNSNEKYNYLDTNLTTNASRVSRINAGDIKLFGSNCLVVFYESFNTSYSYTNLGKVDNANDFVNELGRGSVAITFELTE